MKRSNLHQGYATLLAAKSFAVLDPDTKGATNADETRTIEEELAADKGVPLFYEEEFSSRDSKKRRQGLTDQNAMILAENDTPYVIAEKISNFNVVDMDSDAERDI